MEDEIEQVTIIYNQITEFLVNYSFQILGAVIIVLLGVYVARKVSDLVLSLMLKRKLDITLSKFTASAIKITIIVMVAIMALGNVGISITPFVAAVGALSLGAGLALQGLLSNYGAGVGIIVSRPFVVGDTITVQGVTGIVMEIKLAYTILSDEDEIQITIPNRHIVGEIIHNSHADSIVEITVGIAYHCDPEQAVQVIREALSPICGISSSRQPLVGIENFGDSSIDIGVRCWVRTQLLYETRYQANMAIHKALAANDIEIPFPQRDVHLVQADND